MAAILSRSQCVNYLWSNEAVCRRETWLLLVKVMACRLGPVSI